MIRCRGKSGFVANLLLALLLVAAQTTALAHAYVHEAGTPQTKACATCVTANQLSSACVDSAAAIEFTSFSPALGHQAVISFASKDAIVVRQRGPPATLQN